MIITTLYNMAWEGLVIRSISWEEGSGHSLVEVFSIFGDENSNQRLLKISHTPEKTEFKEVCLEEAIKALFETELACWEKPSKGLQPWLQDCPLVHIKIVSGRSEISTAVTEQLSKHITGIVLNLDIARSSHHTDHVKHVSKLLSEISLQTVA